MLWKDELYQLMFIRDRWYDYLNETKTNKWMLNTMEKENINVDVFNFIKLLACMHAGFKIKRHIPKEICYEVLYMVESLWNGNLQAGENAKDTIKTKQKIT